MKGLPVRRVVEWNPNCSHYHIVCCYLLPFAHYTTVNIFLFSRFFPKMIERGNAKTSRTLNSELRGERNTRYWCGSNFYHCRAFCLFNDIFETGLSHLCTSNCPSIHPPTSIFYTRFLLRVGSQAGQLGLPNCSCMHFFWTVG